MAIFESVDAGEDEMAASETALLESIGILANSIESYKKLQKNRSGICFECGKKIRKERLEILPNCNYCAPCQAKSDDINGNKGRATPYRNTPISAVFNTIKDVEDKENEDEDEEKAKDSDSISPEELPAGLNHALKARKREKFIE